MQAFFVEFRVVPHHVAQRSQAAVVHVGRGQGQVAQRRHLEFTEVAMLGPQMFRCRGIVPRSIVVMGAKLVPGARQQALDAALAARVDAVRLDEEGDADVAEFAVGKQRTGMAGGTLPAAEEQAQAALRRRRIGGGRLRIALPQGVAEAVEGRRRRDQGLLPGGDGFRDIHHEVRVVGIGRFAEGPAVMACQHGFAAQGPRHARRLAAHFARVEDGPQAGRPQTVVAAIPAEPALVAHIEQARRVADAGDQPARHGAAILEAARRVVATGAGQAPAGRKARMEKQIMAEAYRRGMGRHPVAGIGGPLQRPWAMGRDPFEFGGIEADGFGGRGGKREQQRQGRAKPSTHAAFSEPGRHGSGACVPCRPGPRRRTPTGPPCAASCRRCESAHCPAA